MGFQFKSLNEEEIKALNIMQPGKYNFEVIKAKEKLSKSGNPRLELQLQVWDSHGKIHIVFDSFTDHPKMMYKIKHFCEATGLINKYSSNCLEEIDCEGKRGVADIIIQKGQPKDGGFYPDRNAIRDYIVGDVGTLVAESASRQAADNAFHEDF